MKIALLRIFLLHLQRKHVSSPRRLMIQCNMNTTPKGKLQFTRSDIDSAPNTLKIKEKDLVSGSQENIITSNYLPPKVTQTPVWFAMSAPFGRVLKAKALLDSKSVKCFVPMKYEMVIDKEKGKVRKLVPAISNLIFAYTTKDNIQSIKKNVSYLQYLIKREEERNLPIIVPDNQMEQFIKVCETHNEKLHYLAPDEIKLTQGTPVRIIGSEFDGVEGLFVRVQGKRKKQVVVLIQGVTAVVLAEFTDGYLQVLNTSD